MEVVLFSDAEGGEDQIEDVVWSGLAGERIEGPKSAVKVEQDHLMWNPAGVRLRRVIDPGQSGGHRLVMAQAGQHARLAGGSA